MSIDADDVLVSVAPEDLELATQFDTGIELKFDWEHDALLTGEESLVETIHAAGVDPQRIESVHLPPGTSHRNGMAVTQKNRGRIIDFVHAQLTEVPNAYLTVHPPKRFEYREQMQLLEELPSLVERPVSIENLPVECQWHTIPALAYYAHLGRTADRLSGFWLTIDSAHLPDQPRRPSDMQPLTEEWAGTLRDSLASQGLSLPEDFRQANEQQLRTTAAEYLSDNTRSSDEPSRWTPFAQTLFLVADRTKSIHLNDPETDSVPTDLLDDPDPRLEGSIEYALNHDVKIVFEPSGTDQKVPDILNEV